MTAIFEILPVCSGRDHRDLDECRQDRGRSDRTRRGPVAPARTGWLWAGTTWRAAGSGFVAPRGMRTCSQGKKVVTGVAGRRSRRSRFFDQTCHIEDVLAAPWVTRSEGIGDGGSLVARIHRSQLQYDVNRSGADTSCPLAEPGHWHLFSDSGLAHCRDGRCRAYSSQTLPATARSLRQNL